MQGPVGSSAPRGGDVFPILEDLTASRYYVQKVKR